MFVSINDTTASASATTTHNAVQKSPGRRRGSPTSILGAESSSFWEIKPGDFDEVLNSLSSDDAGLQQMVHENLFCYEQLPVVAEADSYYYPSHLNGVLLANGYDGGKMKIHSSHFDSYLHKPIYTVGRPCAAMTMEKPQEGHDDGNKDDDSYDVEDYPMLNLNRTNSDDLAVTSPPFLPSSSPPLKAQTDSHQRPNTIVPDQPVLLFYDTKTDASTNANANTTDTSDFQDVDYHDQEVASLLTDESLVAEDISTITNQMMTTNTIPSPCPYSCLTKGVQECRGDISRILLSPRVEYDTNGREGVGGPPMIADSLLLSPFRSVLRVPLSVRNFDKNYDDEDRDLTVHGTSSEDGAAMLAITDEWQQNMGDYRSDGEKATRRMVRFVDHCVGREDHDDIPDDRVPATSHRNDLRHVQQDRFDPMMATTSVLVPDDPHTDETTASVFLQSREPREQNTDTATTTHQRTRGRKRKSIASRSSATKKSSKKARGTRKVHQSPRFSGDQARRWESRFREVQEIARTTGHAIVPRNHPNKKLAGWVSRQKHQYKLYLSGESTSTMSEERVEMLESIFESIECK